MKDTALRTSSGRRQPVIRLSSISPRFVIGVGLVALGAALFGLGIFHGFENGSCSSTGYSAHYGPVPHCGKGVGWWMLMLMAGLVVLAGGVIVSETGALAGPALFVAIGAPFIVLALRSSSTHLLFGSSAGSGKLFAGIFGACFVIAGAVWGVISGFDPNERVNIGSGFGGLLSFAVGLGLAFVIASGVASAIGTSTSSGSQLVPGASQSTNGHAAAAAAQATAAATTKANAAIEQATQQAAKATKLAACVTAAGPNIAKIQACEAKYLP